MRWIIGIVAVVVIAILGYQYFGGARDIEDVAQRAEEGAQQAGQAVEQAARDAGQAVQETAEKAADAVTGAAEEATRSAEQAADEATAGAERAAEATQETAERAGEAAQQTAEEAATATEQTAREAAGAAEEAGQDAAQAVGAGTEQATEAAEAMQESLNEAQTAALTVGDVNLGEQLGEVVQNVDTTLDGITDAASAEAALPKLNDLNTKLEGLKGTVGQLPDDAKKILADFLDPRLGDLKATAEDVMNRTGVGDVLRPVVEPILATLDSWARQPA